MKSSVSEKKKKRNKKSLCEASQKKEMTKGPFEREQRLRPPACGWGVVSVTECKDAKLHLLLRLRVLSRSYANVKKCSNEGRALMQLDFQQFLMKLEKLTDLRPIPDKEFVETYIKAYYLTENDMEQFIKNHRVSSSAWLFGFLPADLCCPSGVLHEAASQPGECLPGLAHKQEGSSEAPGGHRRHRQTKEIDDVEEPQRGASSFSVPRVYVVRNTNCSTHTQILKRSR